MPSLTVRSGDRFYAVRSAGIRQGRLVADIMSYKRVPGWATTIAYGRVTFHLHTERALTAYNDIKAYIARKDH